MKNKIKINLLLGILGICLIGVSIFLLIYIKKTTTTYELVEAFEVIDIDYTDENSIIPNSVIILLRDYSIRVFKPEEIQIDDTGVNIMLCKYKVCDAFRFWQIKVRYIYRIQELS